MPPDQGVPGPYRILFTTLTVDPSRGWMNVPLLLSFTIVLLTT